MPYSTLEFEPSSVVQVMVAPLEVIDPAAGATVITGGVTSPPVVPAASHSVPFMNTAASVALVQPPYRVLPDWPVPSSAGEESPMPTTLPLPKRQLAHITAAVAELRQKCLVTVGFLAVFSVMQLPASNFSEEAVP